VIAASGAAALLFPSHLHAQTTTFSWNALVAQAAKLAREPYREAPAHPGAGKVDYDALHKAQFRPERGLWNDIPGDVAIRFFPLSANADRSVSISAVERGQVKPVAYDPSMFDMTSDNPVAALGPDAGFAGFRVMNAARDADWLVFMGASYFRAAGAQKQYGLSARGVALNTGAGPEEFPRFTSFWLERVGNGLTVYALLDGASITGAYRFTNNLDGKGVHQVIDAALFPRRPIAELGLIPMTSMFWYDEAHRRIATDWRPEIHDSDGLLIRDDGNGATFRAIVNPKDRQTTPFARTSPAGFGLVQRDRDFDHYQDDGVFYDRRPSLWATPLKPLGGGEVRLYEFPTDSEYTDNIAAYWTPRAPVRAGKRIDLSYRLDWQSEDPGLSTGLARVASIWRGKSDVDGGGANAIRLIVDFVGAPKKSGLAVEALVGPAKLLKQAAYPVIALPNTWRTVLDVAPVDARPIPVQVRLMDSSTIVSEIFHYSLQP
jgi:glucans biosynthesis protein